MPPKTDTSAKYSRVDPSRNKRPVHGNTRPQTRSFRRHQSLLWMVLSLVNGIAFAVGHHFFYASFDGHPVDETSTCQDWIIRIGTGMAFIAKTLFVVAASIAYIQHQWLTMGSKPFKIRQIDTMSNILGDALGFFGTRIWLRFPVLSLLAGLTW